MGVILVLCVAKDLPTVLWGEKVAEYSHYVLF